MMKHIHDENYISTRHRATRVFKNITPEKLNSVIYLAIPSPMTLLQAELRKCDDCFHLKWTMRTTTD